MNILIIKFKILASFTIIPIIHLLIFTLFLSFINNYHQDVFVISAVIPRKLNDLLPPSLEFVSSSSLLFECPKIFQGRCRCHHVEYHNRPTFVTNCTNSHFNGNPQAYLQQVDNRTEVLIMTGNRFIELSANLLNQIKR